MSAVNPAVTGAWLEYHDPGDRQFIKIGDLTLESGQALPDVVIAYQSWGKLNSAGDNAILVNHALTGWADVNGWWPQMVGSGLPFDSDKYFVVCPNVIGGCQGSTGPSSIAADGKRWGSRFPVLTIRDMVAAELAFTKKIGVNKYQLSVGPSLGGMRSLEWAIDYPQLIGAICTIGSSAVATGDQIGAASIQLRAIKSDPNFNNGDY
jgi:homoserine O-acetyltransferase